MLLFSLRYERVVTTSDEIARGIAERQARGETLRAGFFDGPGSEGDTIAAAALLAAEDQIEPANLTILAEIVAAAAFTPDLDRQSALSRISALRASDGDLVANRRAREG